MYKCSLSSPRAVSVHIFAYSAIQQGCEVFRPVVFQERFVVIKLWVFEHIYSVHDRRLAWLQLQIKFRKSLHDKLKN